jgi:hypothetical protein
MKGSRSQNQRVFRMPPRAQDLRFLADMNLHPERPPAIQIISNLVSVMVGVHNNLIHPLGLQPENGAIDDRPVPHGDERFGPL